MTHHDVLPDMNTIDAIVDVLNQTEYDTVIVPCITARNRLVQRLGTGFVPRIVTYAAPLVHMESIDMIGQCLATEHCVALTMAFLGRKRMNGFYINDAGLLDMAQSFVYVWNHMDAWNGDWSDIVQYDDGVLSGRDQTIEVFKEWAQWWLQWVKENNVYSKAQWSAQARQLFVRHACAQSRLMVCVVDPLFFNDGHDIESWVGDVCALSHVQCLPVQRTEKKMNKRSIQKTECSSINEKARIMALSIVHSLNHHHPVALCVSSMTLVNKIDFFLRKWTISSPTMYHGILSSFMMVVMQSAVDGVNRKTLAALGLDPLVRHYYPIAPQMVAWLCQHPECDIACDSGEKASCGAPLWVHRVVSHVSHSMNGLWSMTDMVAPLDQWIDAHIHAMITLVPFLCHDMVAMQSLFEYQKAYSQHAPLMTLGMYRLWCQHVTQKWRLRDVAVPGLYLVADSKESVWAYDHHCIYDDDQHPQCMSWLPKSLAQAIGLDTGRLKAEWETQRSHLLAGASTVHCVTVTDQNTESTYASLFPSWFSEAPSRHIQSSGGVLETKSLTPALTHVSIGDLQAWITDPADFYRRRILKIRSHCALPAQDWGMAMHRLMRDFVRLFPPHYTVSLDQMTVGLMDLASRTMPPASWWKKTWIDDLYVNIASFEYALRQEEPYRSITECSGVLYDACHGSIRLTGRADRIDIFSDQTVRIIDYKTGTVPTYVSMERMQSVQLPLQGVMAQKGAFNGTPYQVRQMAWCHISVSKGCTLKSYPGKIDALLNTYIDALPAWMAVFAKGQYDPGGDQ